ncbi:hypothetical protein C470_12578 [Halorubrum distributum JCM 13561]|uniref:Uncharacterized protein n=1 Tax=Halorubrum distributum JCM 13561 TaxID=1227483 RepID=M0NJI1_9EURY|nr:hypothetical protein [Halorubrum litoreum]EMA58127.1 hypothetical protein C470_12578 [Halorubrum litoreum JCM 13561]
MSSDRDGSNRPDTHRSGRPIRRASRRGVIALGATGLLAGCLVTSEEEGSDTRQTDDGANGSDSDGDGSSNDGGSGDDSGSDDAGEPTPDEVEPDGSGLVVTETSVLSVSEDRGQTTVRARLTVQNAGRFEYGVVELRVDAYATPAGTSDREAVGDGDVTRRFTGDDRFDGSRPRRFTVEITFPDDRTNVRPDPDRYAVDAAVRRAEPV